MQSLSEVHLNKTGKLSDKWEIYLNIYNDVFSPYRSKEISLLEIGVQNGGSLETWGQYFEQAINIVGCDINPDISHLKYDDNRIKVFVGDGSSESGLKNVIRYASYDIIIDDGSHTSRDIIRTFCILFPLLNDDGCFVIEDLHCSYWKEFDGGIYAPYSSVGFLKKLADIINHEHWGIDEKRALLIEHELSLFDINICEAELEKIHSISFYNSVCVIKKKKKSKNVLGRRLISGEDEIVVSGHKSLNKTFISVPDQSENCWNTIYESPLSVYFELKDKIEVLQNEIQVNNEVRKQDINALEENISYLESLVNDKDRQIELNENEINRLKAIEDSNVWRSTRLLRMMLEQVKKAIFIVKLLPHAIKKKGGVLPLVKQLIFLYKQHGLEGFKIGVRSFINNNQVSLRAQKEDVDFLFNVKKTPTTIFKLKVLIIAELSIPQCEKYRVNQKKEMFESLGYQCETVSWTDYFKAKHLISLSSLVIFYRVPAVDIINSLIGECKRLNIRTLWEVDDLIFDKDIIEKSKTTKSLDASLQKELANGAILYKEAMLQCDQAIASTSGLAKAMMDAGIEKAFVVENALDSQTLNISREILAAPIQKDGKARIVYGSGTLTHNVDFEEAAGSIARILSERDDVIFRIIGMLELPTCFDGLESKIERIEFCKYEEYLKYLSECQISIAPLESYIFNESKSNIKYIEASIVKVASVCSPLSAFSDVISSNKNGILASNPGEWYSAFELLLDDAELRSNIADEAYDTVIGRYTPHAVAEQQLKKVALNDELGYLKQEDTKQRKIKVMSFNVFYSPRSFGGATIVAEQINQLLEQQGDNELYVVTTMSPSSFLREYETMRYEVNGVTVFAIGVPSDMMESYYNPKLEKVVDDIIQLVDPDLAHVHCIQGLGVGILDACKKNSVKYIITLHDAWWICPRQFMINNKGVYCNQNVLDKNVCKRCVGSSSRYEERQNLLLPYLQGASQLLAPSEFFTKLHNINNVSDKAVICNKNGIKKPHKELTKFRSEKISFGYVGGNTPIKGIHLILGAFQKITDESVDLKIVDNLMNLGGSSFSDSDFEGITNYQIIPAYNQDTIDDYFNSIDVLLFPTQWKESFGLTVREAISRNVWVISTDAGGMVEDIIEGENGFIIPFNSGVDELVDAIYRTVKHFNNLDPGQPVQLEKSSIRYFEEQSSELNSIINSVV